MFHIPVVLAMTYLAHGRPVVLMNFEPRETLQAIEAERVSAFLGITTMLNYMMAVDDFDRHDLSVTAADQVRRRADGRRASSGRSWSASRAT